MQGARRIEVAQQQQKKSASDRPPPGSDHHRLYVDRRRNANGLTSKPACGAMTREKNSKTGYALSDASPLAYFVHNTYLHTSIHPSPPVPRENSRSGFKGQTNI